MAFERHRDKNGEIGRKHGNTPIRTLRKRYGKQFAVGCADKEKLSEVLEKVDEPSLSKLVRDHEGGKLEQIPSGIKERAQHKESLLFWSSQRHREMGHWPGTVVPRPLIKGWWRCWRGNRDRARPP